MHAIDGQRPPTLYRYGEKHELERALMLGEFHLCPAANAQHPATRHAEHILPFRAKEATPAHMNYLTLSLATTFDDALFDACFAATSCLVIHRAEEFGERIHRAAVRALPNWAGIDAAVSYGVPSPLGAAFSKARQYAQQKEWLFAWRPINIATAVRPVVIQIGNIEDIAELRQRHVC